MAAPAPGAERRRAMGAALALAALVGLPACKADPGAEPMRLVPVDATTIVRLDLKRLRGTELDKRIQRLIKANDYLRWKLADFATQTGIEVLVDLDSALLAVPAPSGAGATEDWLAVVRGRVDRGRLTKWWEERTTTEGGTPRQRQQGKYTVYVGKDESANLVMLSSRTVLIGSKTWVDKAIDLAAGKGAAAASRPQIGSLIQRIEGTRVLSALMYLTDSQRALITSAQNPTLAKVTSATLRLDSTSEVAGDVIVDTLTPDAAKGLSTNLASELKALRGNPLVAKAGLTGVLDKLTNDVEGSTIRLRVTLTPALLDQLVTGAQNIANLMAQERAGDLSSALRGKSGRKVFDPLAQPSPLGMPAPPPAPGPTPAGTGRPSPAPSPAPGQP